MTEPFDGGQFIADTSAHYRAGDPKVREQWIAAYERGLLLTCLVVRFELLYSARNVDEFDDINANLADLRDVPITVSVQRAALGSMRELAQEAQHRVKLSDLLVAAAAQEASVGVLHCDADFDLLATTLSFDSRWLLRP
ncbi:MAG: PIN domain-containing protein [Actinomycetota bacterium]|nr:PIN domain-containing protein [Actinomycetota bacterium]